MNASSIEPSPQHTAPRHGCRVLIEALAARSGGTAYAAVQLARQPARRDDVSAVAVLTRRGSIVDRGLARERDVERVVLATPARAELVHRLMWEGSRLPSLVSQLKCDVLVTMS